MKTRPLTWIEYQAARAGMPALPDRDARDAYRLYVERHNAEQIALATEMAGNLELAA